MIKRPLFFLLLLSVFVSWGTGIFAKEAPVILFHLKTSLDHDDAQICVAYNEIWARLKMG